jgi:hypothetical protein
LFDFKDYTMQRIIFFYFLLVFLSATVAQAQYNTGSDDLNSTLIKIDADAGINFGAFKADVSGRYNISENKLDYLHAKVGMSAGDIYMTVEIGKIAKVSIDHVVEVYQSNRGKGWGVIAKELGIKPGSSEFHALKGHGGKDNGSSKGPKGKGKKG